MKSRLSILLALLLLSPAPLRADDELDRLLKESDPLTETAGPAAGDAPWDLGGETGLGSIEEILATTSPASAATTGSAAEAWGLLHILSQRVRSPAFERLPADVCRRVEEALLARIGALGPELEALARKRLGPLMEAARSGGPLRDDGLEAALDGEIAGAVPLAASAAEDVARRQEDRWGARFDGLAYAAPDGMPAVETASVEALLSPIARRGAETFAEAGSAHYAASRSKEAAESFRIASVLDPKDPVHPYNRARALYKLGQFASSLSEAARADRIGPADRRYVALQVGCLRALGRFEEARALLRESLRGAESGGLKAYLHGQIAAEQLADGDARAALESLKLAALGFVPAEIEAKHAALAALAWASLGDAARGRDYLAKAQAQGLGGRRIERVLRWLGKPVRQ